MYHPIGCQHSVGAEAEGVLLMTESEIPGHEGHDHGFIDDALVEKLMRDVDEAKIINNLFLIPVITGGPPRFVLTRVDDDHTIHTFGYVPFDMMLDVGIGFITAVRNAVRIAGALEDSPTPEGEERPEPSLAGGLFKVI